MSPIRNDSTLRCAAVVVAAGSSTRMGAGERSTRHHGSRNQVRRGASSTAADAEAISLGLEMNEVRVRRSLVAVGVLIHGKKHVVARRREVGSRRLECVSRTR